MRRKKTKKAERSFKFTLNVTKRGRAQLELGQIFPLSQEALNSCCGSSFSSKGRHFAMSSVLHYDIIAQIIDIVGENYDINLIKELALVSHSFNQICGKHLFATVDLYDDIPIKQASSKKGFVKLLKRRPEVVKYIRKLTYNLEYNDSFHASSFSSTNPCSDHDDNLLSLVLPNFLRTISFLSCLTITARTLEWWSTVHSSLTSALLHLMHLPTINHIDLSSIDDFPLSSLTTTGFVNLRRLDIFSLTFKDDVPDIVVPSEMKIREFHTLRSSLLTTKLLRAETQDGQPVFNFMDLRRLSIDLSCYIRDEWNLRYLLQNARSLKELGLAVCVFTVFGQLALFETLEAMTGNNMLEVFSLELLPKGSETEDFIGSTFQAVEEMLIKPGWSALRQVSFKVASMRPDLFDALQSIPERYLSHILKLESVYFSYECNLEQNDYD